MTQQELHQILHYNPDTGVFTRLGGMHAKRWAGKPAGVIHKGHGYVTIKIGQKGYLAHRLAWLYVHGVWPTVHLDHKNCIRHDNRIENLREADHVQNAANRRTQCISASGLKGVKYVSECVHRPWLAYISRQKKVICLGFYATQHEASRAYLHAAQEIYGEFARAK